MTNEKTDQTEMEDFISSFLDHHVGERPQSVNAVMRRPFIVVHLIGFLLSSEKFLLKREETKRVAETRDVMLKGIKLELSEGLAKITGIGVKEIYADWNFEKESGLLLITLDTEMDSTALAFPEDVDKEAFHERIIGISKKTQKKPDVIESYWLNGHTILVERRGIMVDIEIELIKNGVIEELRLAKRPLEHRIMEFFKLEPVLKQGISELFVDWNFEEDKSFMVFILEPKSN